MDHGDIWRAIDVLAAENGLSVSGLARRAGLDPTVFNPSKRRTPVGRARWPSTESLAKVLRSTGTSLDIFSGLVAGQRAIPSAPANRHAGPGFFGGEEHDRFCEDGDSLASGSWELVPTPRLHEPGQYTLRITDGSMQPVLRAGGLIIVSPTLSCQNGDRVVVRTIGGETIAKKIVRNSARWLDLGDLGSSGQSRRYQRRELSWVHRIVWASQ